jgi:hypothetical protein
MARSGTQTQIYTVHDAAVSNDKKGGLPLCLMEHYTMKTCEGVLSTASRPWSTGYSLDRRLVGLLSWYGYCGEE